MEPFVEAPAAAEIPPPAIEQTETGLDSLAQKAFDKLFGDQKMDLNSTFASVSGTNPDEAAKAQSVGGQVGVGQDLAMQNMAAVKKAADQKRFESYDLMATNPVLGRMMAGRQFASVAHDDIPQLSAIGTLFKVLGNAATGQPFPVEAALEVYSGFTRGTNTYELGNIANEYLRTGDKELALKRKKEVDALSIGLPEAQGFLGSTSEFIGNMVMAQPEAAAYAAAYGVGGLAIGAATGLGALATGAIGASAGYMTGMAITAFRVERGAMILDMLEKGYDEDTVQIVGNVAGSINAALEMTGLKIFSAPARKFATKFIKEEILKRTTNEIEKVGLKKLIKETTLEYGKGVFAESATETMQDVVGKLADQVVSLAGTSNLQFNSDGTIQSANPEQSMREFAGQLVDTFIYTAKGAAVLGAFGAGMQIRHNLKQIATAKETTQFLTDLSKNVQATKLKGRSPSALANFVAAQAQGTAAETMYVDAEEMANVLNQSGLTAQQIDNALPGVREQLSKATSGGDIQIPTAQFAANIVGTKLEAPLMEHARLAPDAISAKQAIAQQETMQQNMKDAQAEMAVQEKVNAQFVSEAKEIEKVVNDQLIAAGRPPTEAAFAAKLVQARAVTGAAAAGITPAQWVARHPVPTFQSQQQAAQAAQQAPAKPFVSKVYQETTVTPEQTASLTEPLAAAESELAEAKTANSITERGGKQIGDSLSKLKMALTSGKLGEIATQAWKLLERLKEIPGMKVASELAAKTLAALTKLGVEFYDPTGRTYTEGWVEVQIVSWLPYKEGVSKDQPFVEKVISPVVRRNGENIQRGQVVVREGRINHEENLASQAKDAEIEAKMQSELDALQTKLKEEGKTDEAIKQLVAERKAELEAKAREERYGKEQQQAPAQGSLEQAQIVNATVDGVELVSRVGEQPRTEPRFAKSYEWKVAKEVAKLLGETGKLQIYDQAETGSIYGNIIFSDGKIYPVRIADHPISGQGAGKTSAKKLVASAQKNAVIPYNTTDPNTLKQELSTRRPSSVTATEDPLTTLLTISHEQTLRTPEVLAKNVEILKKLTPMRFLDENATPEQQLENFLAQASDNLVALYNLMPPELRERAKLWYPGGRRMLDYISSNTGLSPMQVGGVFAVLSPQKDWYENVTLGNRIIDIVTTQSDFVWDDKMSATAAKLKEVARLAAEEAKVLRKAKAEIALTRAGGLEAMVEQPDWNTTEEAQAELEKEAVQARKVSDRLAKAVEKSEDQEDSAAMKLYDDLKGTTLKELLSDPYKAAVWVRVFDQTFNEQSYRILLPEGGVGETRTTQAGTKSSLRWAGYGAVAKAISVIVDGRAENVFYQIGNEHKVRNFYNNLFAPESGKYITIDTHAVAAANFMPLAGTDDTVAHAFGGSAASGETGQSGAYSIYFEAYRRAAEAVGVLPREMQSITWEAVRGLFEASKKKTFKPLVKNIWEKYKSGELTQEQAREEIIKLVGGITNPSWAASEYNESPGQTYEGVSAKAASEKSVKVKTIQKSEVLFEVAPDPTDANLSSRWDALDPETKHGISANVAAEIVPEVLKEFGVSGEIIPQVGGWQGKTNPGFALRLESGPLTRQVAKALGHALSQQGMFSISAEKFEGSQESGLISIQLPDGYTEKQVGELYEKLWKLEHNGKQIIQGHSTIDGKMAIINDTGIDTAKLADMIDKHLGGAFEITETKANTAFDSKDTYGSNLQRPASKGISILGTRRIDSFRQHATRLIDQEVARAEEAAGKLNQSAVPAAFYSALGVEVGKSTTKSASADSWKQQIKGLIAKGVVKEKEVYWAGLNDWLDLQEGKITKEQVQAFLDAGGVKVEVQQKSDDLALKEAVETGTAQAYLALQDADAISEDIAFAFDELEEINAEGGDDYRRGQLHAIIDVALDEQFGTRIDDYIEGESEGGGLDAPTKYSRYQLPGGTNYREALVTLPRREKTIPEIEKEMGFVRPLTNEQQDQVLTQWKQHTPSSEDFQTSHWNEPNILVHLRMNDRVDADGKKVLFVEEVQSDWGQAGREKGFVTPIKQEDIDKEEILRNKLSEAKTNLSVARIGVGVEQNRILAKLGLESYTDIISAGEQRKELTDAYRKLVVDDKEYAIAAEKERLAVAEEIRTSTEYSAAFEVTRQTSRLLRAPFIESTSGWLELGLKQILLEAVNGGYDRVAFVDGDQSVQRYRKALTEAVDEVEITRNDDGTYTYSAIKGGKPVQGEQSVSANRINEVFGKAGSKQLLEEADAKPDEIHTIASGDIEIGGEGMRKFYDTIVPQALGKMLKKLGGDKIENVNMITEKPVTQEQINAAEKRKDFTEAERLTAIYERQQLGRGISEKGDQQVGEQQGFTVTPALAAQVSQGLPLFQAAEGGARGEIDPVKNLITIKNANSLTTFHELMHWFVIDLFRTATDPAASELSKSDADILLKWFGIGGSNMQERIANWNAMTLEEQRRHHETAAYNAEIWVATGRAPSVELQGVFERFRRWATRAYKSIRDDLNEIYKQQFGTDLPFMTDEVRGVFDRMLASEEQIARREAIDNFKGMYQTQEESGMNDATWAAYQAELAEAHEMAVTDLTKATVKQMEWLSGARKGILKAMQAAHNALRRTVQGEESDKMNNEPVRKAERFFKTGKMVDPDGKEIEVLVGNKIDSVAVGGMYPTSTTGLAPAVDLTKLRGMTMEGGLAPDLAAEMFGFSSGDQLIRALAELKPFKDELKERTDARMLDEHGGMNTEAEKEEAVNKALANEVRARIVAIENRYLTKVKTPVAVIMQGAKELARTILGRMAIKDIKPRNYVAAEARVAKDKHTAVKAMQSPETAGKSAYTRSFNEQIAAGVEESAAASEALVKSVEAIKRAQAKIDAHKKQYGDVDPAIVAMKASHQQVIQGQLAKEGYKILDEVDKALAYVKRIVSDTNRKKMGADHADQIEAILERFGLMGRYVAPTTRTPLATWAQTQQDIGFDIEIPDIVQESVRKNFLELTPEEFQDVIDTVKQIAHTGKTQQLVLTMDRKITFEKAKTEIVDSINENAGGRKAKTRTATTNIGRSIETLTGFFAAHLKAAIVAQIMDGGKDGGPLWNYLIRSANNAGNKETTMRAAATKRISEILDPVFKNGKMGGAGVYFPSVDRSFNRESVLTIALNMGNESNMQRLLDGEGWTLEQVMPIIQSLTAAELNAVQEVWDYSETFKAEIIEKSRRTVGREPNWIEPKPLQVMSADGQMVSLKGGYYPVKYDPRASARSQSLSAADQALRDLKDAHIASTTRRSYTKSRVKEVHDRPLLLNLSGLYSGIGEVIHDLSWHEWLIDSNRLMRSSAFDKAVREQYGVEFKDQITSWIKDVAAGDKGANNAGEMALNYLRQGVSAAGLGFNLMSAVGQITGFAQSVVKVGAKWIGRGIAASASNPSAAIERVYALSPFMANRGSTQFRELNEIKNMVRGENVAMKRVKAGTYFLMMQMQRMVDIPTWIGAYEKQLSINSDEKLAIAIADQAVIDSQGGGMLKDLAAIERGGPIQKLFTVFYSFMNTNLNLAVLKGMTEKNAGKWVAQQTMLWVVPVVTMYMLKKLLTPQAGDDDDKFDLKEMAKDLAAEELSFMMGSFMVVREFADAAKIVTGAKTYGTDYRGPAGLRMIGDTYKFATQAAQLEFDTAFRKAAINIIGSSAGLPAAQINRTIDGIEALMEGETENITAPLFGVKKR